MAGEGRARGNWGILGDAGKPLFHIFTMPHLIKDELHNILSGKSPVGIGTTIQAATRHLDHCEKTGSAPKGTKHFKREEEARLEEFISINGLWTADVDFSQYVSEGAEQKVYLRDSEHVLKLNDSIYYETWRDYFHSLLLHDHFFPDTAYELIGFTKANGILHAIVQQPFVLMTDRTELEQVKSFMKSNGFSNTRNNDYFNPELGIILEDLHDENVLTRNGVLYFIDTVFYLTEKFWSSR
jgi:hypothetical protein